MKEYIYSPEYINNLKKRFPEIANKSNDEIMYILKMNDERHKLQDGSLEGMQKPMTLADINIINGIPKGLDYLKDDDVLNMYVQSFFTIDNSVKANPSFQETLCADFMYGVINDIQQYPEAYKQIRELKSFQELCKSNGDIRWYIREFGQRMYRDRGALEKFLTIESDEPFIGYCRRGGDDVSLVMTELVILHYRGLYDKLKTDKSFLSACKTGHGYEIKEFIEKNYPHSKVA